MSRLQDVIVWKPEKPGDIKLTLTVPQTGGERYLDNQLASKRRSPSARSNCTCSSSSPIPRWEYRYLRNALQRDPGVEVNTLLFHPDLGKPGAGRGYLSAMPEGGGTREIRRRLPRRCRHRTRASSPSSNAPPCKSSCATRPPASSSCPACAASRPRCKAPPLADLMPIVWDDAQPRGYGTSDARQFRADRGRRAQPAHQARGHRRSQRAGLAEPPRLPMVRARRPRQGRHGSPRHPRHGEQQLRAHPSDRHEDLRRRQNPLHGHRWRMALAQRRRGQVPLPLLGPGGALDGLPAQHVAREKTCASSIRPTAPAPARC